MGAGGVERDERERGPPDEAGIRLVSGIPPIP